MSFIITSEEWRLLQWAKLVQSGDLAPLPAQDHDDEVEREEIQ